MSEFCMPRLTAVRIRGGSGAMPRALMPPNALNRRRRYDARSCVRVFVRTRLNVPALVRRNLWQVAGLCPRQTQGLCPQQVHELCHQNAQYNYRPHLFGPMARSPMPSHLPWPPKSSRRSQCAAGVGSRIALFEMHGHCLHALLHALKTDQTCAQGAVRQHGLRNQRREERRRDAPAAACPRFGRASGPSFARSGAPHAAALVALYSKTMPAQELSASLGVLRKSVCELVWGKYPPGSCGCAPRRACSPRRATRRPGRRRPVRQRAGACAAARRPARACGA